MEGTVVLGAYLSVKMVLLLIDAYKNGLGVFLGKGIVDDLLGDTVNDGLDHILGEEPTSGLPTVVRFKGNSHSLLSVIAAGGVLLDHVVGGALGSDRVAGCHTV